jgi:biotin carboxyl carrier protein
MKLRIEMAGQLRQVEIERGSSAGQWQIRLDDETVAAEVALLRPGVLSLLIDGQSHRVVLDENRSDPLLHLDGRVHPWAVEDPRSLRQRRRSAGTDGPVAIKASMPGRVVRVLLEKGDAVAAHQGVVVIEAMKMQNELKSPREGRVAEIRVSPGDTVASGQVLAVIE